MDRTNDIFHKWIFDRLSRTGPKTQFGLADALGIAHPQISELKKGNRELKVREVPPIAKYLGVAPPPWPRDAKARSKAEVLAILRQIDIPEGALEPVWAFISGYLAAELPPPSQPHDQSELANRPHVPAPSGKKVRQKAS